VADPGAAAPAITGFLRRVRRRWLLLRGLQILLVAVAAQYAILAATRVVNRSFQLQLPELTPGLLVALLLLAGAALRARPPRMARQADRALGHEDRLASFLDLGSRRDVDDRYRRAQATETAAALAGVNPRGSVAVPRWLWAAPPLFLWMIYASYFAFFLPRPLQWVQQFRAAVTGGAGGAAPGGSSPGRDVSATGEAGRPAPPPVPEAAKQAAAPPPPSRPHPDRAPGAADPVETAGPVGPAGGESGGGSGAGGAANFPQPARLFSVPVGAALTPVGETAAGTAPKGGGAGTTAPRGRVAFNLVPGRGAGSGLLGPGSGQGTGKDGGLRIEVDFAALSPEVRENVRRYFVQLSSLFTGGSLGTE